MSPRNTMLSFAAVVSLVGAMSVSNAFADSSPAPSQASSVPLPSSGPSANPASPNCYPDINHCASYPSGESVKDNSFQYLTPQQIQQEKTPQPGK